jgi:hypothetical protein
VLLPGHHHAGPPRIGHHRAAAGSWDAAATATGSGDAAAAAGSGAQGMRGEREIEREGLGFEECVFFI